MKRKAGESGQPRKRRRSGQTSIWIKNFQEVFELNGNELLSIKEVVEEIRSNNLRDDLPKNANEIAHTYFNNPKYRHLFAKIKHEGKFKYRSASVDEQKKLQAQYAVEDQEKEEQKRKLKLREQKARALGPPLLSNRPRLPPKLVKNSGIVSKYEQLNQQVDLGDLEKTHTQLHPNEPIKPRLHFKTYNISRKQFNEYLFVQSECMRTQKTEPVCYVCKTSQATDFKPLKKCDDTNCQRAFHPGCASKCPVHFCSECYKKGLEVSSIYQCITCPVAFCMNHLPKDTTGKSIILIYQCNACKKLVSEKK